MPLPTMKDVHVDSALTNVSIAYMQDANNFISDKIFPMVPVQFRSDVYYKYTKADFRRNLVKPRAPGTESAGGGFNITTDNYACDIFAYHKDIPDPVRANSDAAINVDDDATRYLTELFLISREVKWASTFFTTSVWGTDKVGGTDFTVWDDASSDPEKDIDDGKSLILKSTGQMPNTLVVGYDVHNALKRHPLITDRFKYTSPDSITEQMLARYFEIERYQVARASYDTSNEGGTSANSFILGKHALLCHVARSPGLLTPSAGYTFVWSGFTGLNNLGVTISNFRMPQLKSDRIEGEFSYDQKVVATDLGYFFSGASS